MSIFSADLDRAIDLDPEALSPNYSRSTLTDKASMLHRPV
jgi:hypothetical protein